MSIDIAIGAVCCSRLLYYILEVNSHWYYDLVLGLTVWIIYTTDHLIDAYLIKKEASSFRHRLHQKHFKLISLISFLALAINAYLTLHYFPVKIIIAGSALLLFVIAHQTLNYFVKSTFFLFGKEVRIALGYSLGLALSPFMIANQINTEAVIALSIIFLLALINVLFFSTIEKEADLNDQMNSISLRWQRNKIFNCIRIISSLCFLLCFLFIYYSNNSIVGAILLSMLLILILSFRNSKGLVYGDLYRSLGDGIFIIPLILFWL